MSLLQSIKRAKEFSLWLHGKTNDRNITSGIRERTAGSILQHALDIDDAILVLLEQSLPGPALTLARPLFEGYVRGVWLLNFASIEEIDKFLNDKCPEFYEILSSIGKDQTSGGEWIHANKNANWKSFHGLTHGGSAHVKRRNTQEAIEPNYPESELEALIQLGMEVRLRIGAEILSLMNDKIALEQLKEKAENFLVSPPM